MLTCSACKIEFSIIKWHRMKRKPSFLSSFRHALRGIGVVFKQERNFRVQVVVTVFVIVLTIFFGMRTWETVLVILLCASVLILELSNSVIERVADGLSPRLQPLIRDIKDIMAGAVLLVSFVAIVIGILLFWPYIAALLQA